MATRTAAFQKMGVKLRNKRSDYSAVDANGVVVVQLWTDKFDAAGVNYNDWDNPKLQPGAAGTKRPGVLLRSQHLLQAENRRFRVVLGTPLTSPPDGKKRHTKFAAASDYLMEWTELNKETGQFRAKRVDQGD